MYLRLYSNDIPPLSQARVLLLVNQFSTVHRQGHDSLYSEEEEFVINCSMMTVSIPFHSIVTIDVLTSAAVWLSSEENTDAAAAVGVSS